MNKIIFLDRDGTIIHDRGYLDHPDGVKLLPNAAIALKKLSDAGYLLVLITNQSGIGRGYFDLNTVKLQHQRLTNLLKQYHITLADIQICPHAPQDNCKCRKPSPLMLINSLKKLQADAKQSYMIGDKKSDILAGKNCQCKTIIIGKQCPEADYTAQNLLEASQWILSTKG